MRNLLKHRSQAEGGTPRRVRNGSIFDTPSRASTSSDANNFTRTVDVLVSEADRDLGRALSSQEALQNELARLAAEFKDVCSLCFKPPSQLTPG